MNRNVFNGIVTLASGNIVGSVLGALGGILIARFVEPEVNGQFRLFTIPLMYLICLHLGSFEGLQRQIPHHKATREQHQLEKDASAAGAWNVLVTLVVATGFILYSLWELNAGNIQNSAGWATQAVIAIGVYYGGYLGTTYRAIDDFISYAKIQLVQSLLSFLLVFPVQLWGFFGLCLRVVVPVLIGIWLLHRARPIKIPLDLNLQTLQRLLRVGTPMFMWNTLNTSIWVAIEYSLIMMSGGVKWVGIFAVAVIMRETVSGLPQAAYQVLLPRLIEQNVNGTFSSNRNVAFKATLLLVMIMGAGVFFASWAMDSLVPLFIPKYVDGLFFMKVCLVFSIVQAASIPNGILFARGDSWLYGRSILFGFVVFVLTALTLAPYYESAAAIIVASLIGRCARVLATYYDIWKLGLTSKGNAVET